MQNDFFSLKKPKKMKNTEFFLQVTVCIQLNLQSDLRAKARGAQPQLPTIYLEGKQTHSAITAETEV